MVVMENSILLGLVTSVLGKGKKTARGNYSYICPVCKYPTPKLEVKLTKNKNNENPWHCWHCDIKGKTIHSLFKTVGVGSEKFNELSMIIDDPSLKYVKTDDYSEKIELPKEFIPLSDKTNSQNLEVRHILKYLRERGISSTDIMRYNIGYSNYGKYSGRVIIPSYDNEGKLNFYTGRTIKDTKFGKYLNPSANKDVIINEHLINWDLPLILCEGIFDSIAIKRNSIPLMGKTLQKSLMKKIISSKVEKIYLALDMDFFKKTLKIAEDLINEGKEVHVIIMDEKDPSDMGFKDFTNLIQNSIPLTYSKLMELKFSI